MQTRFAEEGFWRFLANCINQISYCTNSCYCLTLLGKATLLYWYQCERVSIQFLVPFERPGLDALLLLGHWDVPKCKYLNTVWHRFILKSVYNQPLWIFAAHEVQTCFKEHWTKCIPSSIVPHNLCIITGLAHKLERMCLPAASGFASSSVVSVDINSLKP